MSKYDENHFDEIYCNIIEDWEERGIDESDLFKTISIPEKTLFLLGHMKTQTLNGGIEQFFGNPSGDDYDETIEALERVGSLDIKDIIELAAAALPGGKLSKEGQEVRMSQISELNEDLSEELLDKFEELLPGFYEKAIRYWEENRENSGI